jgi:hypothetical protein
VKVRGKYGSQGESQFDEKKPLRRERVLREPEALKHKQNRKGGCALYAEVQATLQSRRKGLQAFCDFSVFSLHGLDLRHQQRDDQEKVQVHLGSRVRSHQREQALKKRTRSLRLEALKHKKTAIEGSACKPSAI